MDPNPSCAYYPYIATPKDPISLLQKHDYFHSERMLLESNTTRKLFFHGSLSCVV